MGARPQGPPLCPQAMAPAQEVTLKRLPRRKLWGSWRGAGPPLQPSLHRHPGFLRFPCSRPQALRLPGIWALRVHLLAPLFCCKVQRLSTGTSQCRGTVPAGSWGQSGLAPGAAGDWGDPGKWCCLSYIPSCSLPPRTGCSGLWSFACAASGLVGGACGASELAAFPKDCLRTPGRCPSPTQLARTSQAVGRQ